jgi:hypothetical protein
MEELVAALRTRQLAPAEHNLATTALPAEASTERTPANASLAALNDRIESLEREIAQLRLAASGRAIASPRSATPPAKMTGRVAQTIAQLADATTQAEGRRSLFMLSMPQVLDQLGLPDSTDFSGGDGMRWDYRHEKETLYLHFRGGVVMSIGSARD